jgi:hypothetical protein
MVLKTVLNMDIEDLLPLWCGAMLGLDRTSDLGQYVSYSLGVERPTRRRIQECGFPQNHQWKPRILKGSVKYMELCSPLEHRYWWLWLYNSHLVNYRLHPTTNKSELPTCCWNSLLRKRTRMISGLSSHFPYSCGQSLMISAPVVPPHHL